MNAAEFARQGEKAYEEGRHAEAGAKYEAAYDAMSPETKRGSEGAFVVKYASTAYADAYETTKEIVHLEASQAILVRHKDMLAAENLPFPGDLAAQLESIERRLVDAQPKPEPEPEPEPVPLLEPKPEPAAAIQAPSVVTVRTPVVDVASAKRRQALSALSIAVGSAFTIAGVVLIGVAAPMSPTAHAQRSSALATLDSPAYANVPVEQKDAFRARMTNWVEDAEQLGFGLIIGGAAAATAGVTLVIVGGVGLARARRDLRRAAASLPSPWVGPRSAGLGFTHRF